ncbi:Inositol hexakisphosphate and diphosphoinositol-pentakisphosphate kinase [Venturia nashicola]|uniref:Inositol hexakisphosphate and diphosphoinositol-pentakisphosphate kinase n=1 Tax=Venturia nashicola TaxID=86259 RepID=A0A4Z1PHT1_9PEZI|nr:Inositol hexakisphosphate and diphosphoinositol-pentakisphosphate kinase [Venturia nashicola]TLD37359.1 Inositol hexakisphosphate and diphosphoinositol-pentakisphosphate kinase [Venturia nashicola]
MNNIIHLKEKEHPSSPFVQYTIYPQDPRIFICMQVEGYRYSDLAPRGSGHNWARLSMSSLRRSRHWLIYRWDGDLNRLLLRSRVLVNVSACTTKTTLWSHTTSFPLGIAPAGLQGMAHPHGELATSRACTKKRVPMALSSFSNYGVQEIHNAAVAVAGNYKVLPTAMPLYTMEDRALQLRIIRRAEAEGCKAIFLTSDSPVLGVRYTEWRNDFRTPEGLGYPNLEASSADFRNSTHDSKFATLSDDAHSWERDIPYLRSVTNMEIWIKRVLCAEDVEKAVEAGCEPGFGEVLSFLRQMLAMWSA